MSTPDLPDKAPSYARPYRDPRRTGYGDDWRPEPPDEGMTRAGMERAQRRRALYRRGRELIRREHEGQQEGAA